MRVVDMYWMNSCIRRFNTKKRSALGLVWDLYIQCICTNYSNKVPGLGVLIIDPQFWSY